MRFLLMIKLQKKKRTSMKAITQKKTHSTLQGVISLFDLQQYFSWLTTGTRVQVKEIYKRRRDKERPLRNYV